MSYILPKNEYSMLPPYAYKALHFAEGLDRLALAVTLSLDNENAPVSFSRVPEVEKCIIQTKARLSYKYCEDALISNHHEFINSKTGDENKSNLPITIRTN